MPERHLLRERLRPALAQVESSPEVGRQGTAEDLPAVIRQSEIAVRGRSEAVLRGQQGVEDRQAVVEVDGVELREEMRGGEVVHFPEAAHDGRDPRLEKARGQAEGLVRQSGFRSVPNCRRRARRGARSQGSGRLPGGRAR